MIATIAAALSVTSMARIVYDMATLADLFSVFALPIALSIYRVARRFAERSRAARMSALRETDRKDAEQAVATIRTCRAAALGIFRSAETPGSETLVMAQHLATTIGTTRTQHGHLFNKKGLRAAARAHNAAILILESDKHCPRTNASYIARDLKTLSNSAPPLDDGSLVGRRRRAADAESPA